MSIPALITWLETKDALDLRGCDICTHIDQLYDAVVTHGTYGGAILGPCETCSHTHDCFLLDEEKLAENVELGLTSKWKAKKIKKHQQMRNAALIF